MQRYFSHGEYVNQRYFGQNPNASVYADDDGLGFPIAAVIGAATGVLPFIKSLFSACTPGQACGLAGITSFGNQVIQTLGQIKQMLENGLLPPQQAVSEAQKVAGALADPNFIYQAKKGKDAAALATFKTQAAAIVQEIIQVAATVNTAQVQGIDPATGKPKAAASSVLPTLLIAGGGLLLLMAVKK